MALPTADEVNPSSWAACAKLSTSATVTNIGMSESVLLADAARVRGCFVMPHHMIAEKFSLIEPI
jgi:hypothetical protein